MKVSMAHITRYSVLIAVVFFMAACGGGGGGDDATSSGSSSTVSSTPVEETSNENVEEINTGSSGPLTGTIVIDWTYPADTGVEGFRVYVYDDSLLNISTFATLQSDGPEDFDVEFDASDLGNDANESFYFVIEAFRGTDIARSSAICFTAAGGMNSCQ